MRVKLGVLFGGKSVEHEVSIISAIQAMEHIDNNKYEIIPIYITKEGTWYTGEMLKEVRFYSDMDLIKRYAKEVTLINKDGRFVLLSLGFLKREVTELDICFPVMHGTSGEDGALQGFLETVGIPVCESDHYAAVLGQDKVFMKQVWESVGVPICKYTWFYDYDYLMDAASIVKKVEKLGYPVIVKPARLGSSVGISCAHNETELHESVLEAMKYDTKILVEEKVENLKEVNISVLGNYRKQKVSPIEEVGSSNELLTYEDKYIGGNKKMPSKGMASAKRIIPARIDEDVAEEIRESAKLAFKALGSSGVVRIDYMINSKTNKIYANEINTIPGSLSFYLWDKANMEYRELLDEIINIGIKDYKDSTKKTVKFDTNILANFSQSGAKGSKGIKG